MLLRGNKRFPFDFSRKYLFIRNPLILILNDPILKELAYMATSGGHFSCPLGMEAFEANQYL